MRPSHKAQQGFTLIELATVLVIIGLIIGGVLTGQQVIQNARITNTVNAVQAYEAQFQTYAQNYGALPGDDASATTRFPNAELASSGVGTGNGNGDAAVGTGNSADTTATSGNAAESRLIWAHLRAAGLVKNQVSATGSAVQPTTPFGGVVGFQNGAFSGVFTTTTLCLTKIPGSAAQTIDAKLDDGASDQGSVRATLDTGATGSSSGTVETSYADDQTYTMCAKL